MRHLRLLTVVTAALALGAAAAWAQAPSPTSPTAPPDKIDPRPIRPDAEPGPAEPAAPPAEQAQDPLGVPPTVFAVRIAGSWEAEGRRGFSRVVVTLDGDRQRIYAQWLAEPDGAVAATKELEDEEAAKLVFGDVRAEPERGGGVTVFLDTQPDRDGLRDTWVLVLGAPGEARFGPATN